MNQRCAAYHCSSKRPSTRWKHYQETAEWQAHPNCEVHVCQGCMDRLTSMVWELLVQEAITCCRRGRRRRDRQIQDLVSQQIVLFLRITILVVACLQISPVDCVSCCTILCQRLCWQIVVCSCMGNAAHSAVGGGQYMAAPLATAAVAAIGPLLGPSAGPSPLGWYLVLVGSRSMPSR